MNNSKPYASSCTVKQIAIWKAGSEDDKPWANLKGMVSYLQYHEDIFYPAFSATMVVVDNMESLISSMPIQGFEKVVFEVEDVNNETYSYEFRVWKVANRTNSDRKQVYTLCLISVEGLLNEGMRVNTIQSGTPTEITARLLTQKLGVSPGQIFAQESQGRIKMLPAKKSPFSIIRSLQSKTVAINDPVKPTSADLGGSTGSTFTGTSDVGTGAQKAKGTAGFLFFQTRTGYVFKSIDELCSTKNLPVKGDKYTWSPGKTAYQSQNKIQEIVFGSEIDMMEKMREGTYCSIVHYLDINTGKYEEFVYSLNDTWKDMVHLGSQTDLPIGQSTLAEYPSRVMSTIINNECWYNGVEPAAEKSEYIDSQKRYLSQGLARMGIMFNQQLTISLTGHLELSAGDKIEVRVPNQVLDENRSKEVWDPEHSGTYLIKHLNQQFDIPGQNVYTVLELIRDSYGIKDKESKVITK